MASIKKTTKRIEVRHYENVEVYTLELNRREVAVVRDILGAVLGPMRGPRGTAENIFNMLCDSGLRMSELVASGSTLELVPDWPAALAEVPE